VRAYRFAVPRVRPVLTRWRQFSNEPVVYEVWALAEALRQTQQAARASATTRERTTHRSAGSVAWSLDGDPMPHFDALTEQLERRGGGAIRATGDASGVAAASDAVARWLDRVADSDRLVAVSVSFEVVNGPAGG
jgi:hypothetical protein